MHTHTQGTPFGTPESILKLNGAANVSFTAAAASAGVERYVYVSAATFALMERLFPDSWGKYFEGKRQAEAAVAEHFGTRGTILKPGVIYTSDLAEVRSALRWRDERRGRALRVRRTTHIHYPHASSSSLPRTGKSSNGTGIERGENAVGGRRSSRVDLRVFARAEGGGEHGERGAAADAALEGG